MKFRISILLMLLLIAGTIGAWRWHESRYVVIFGDSIMRGLSADTIGYPTVNMSVSGTLTPQIAEVVSNYQASSGFRRARSVIVEGGVNDLLRSSPESISPSYEKILSYIPSSVPIKVIGVLPFDGTRVTISKSMIDVANAGIQRLCAERPNCTVIAPLGPSPSPSLFYDGLHPTLEGISQIANGIKPHL